MGIYTKETETLIWKTLLEFQNTDSKTSLQHYLQ